MTVRSVLTAAAFTVGLATPVVAQEAHAFERSERSVDVTASRSAANRQRAVRSTAPRRAYVSADMGHDAKSEAVAPVQATRTINVWGSRFEVPVY